MRDPWASSEATKADAKAVIARLCQQGLDADALRREVARVLRRVVPFDAACWSTTDPATLLITSALSDGLSARQTPRFFELEYLAQAEDRFRVLARSALPVRAINYERDEAAGDGLRYRDVLAPNGQAHELRAAFVIDGFCWGTASLFRAMGQPPFDADAVAFVARIGPTIAAGLRLALRLHGDSTSVPSEGPGLLILADDGAVTATTPTAQALLSEMAGPAQADGILPDAVYAVAARARALEHGTVDPNGGPATLRVRASRGWLLLTGARLTDERGVATQTSVIIEQAHPAEIAPILLQAYDISPREAEVVQHVLAGVPSTAIGEALNISPLTVQDHLKKIFDKTGVRSRRELVALLFADQYAPRLQLGPLAS